MIGIPPWPVLAAGAVLALALGVQTIRVSNAHVEIANGKAREAALAGEIKAKRAEGVLAGVALQKAAQAVLDAKAATITTALLLESAKREEAMAKHAAHLDQLLKDGKWLCLRAPMPKEVLDEYAR